MAINVKVDTGNSTGTDYTSLAGWEAGNQKTMTQEEIVTCYATTDTADTGGLNISGWTGRSSSNYIEIKVDDTYKPDFTDLDGSGKFRHQSNFDQIVFRLGDADGYYVKLSDLLLLWSSTSTGRDLIETGSSGNGWIEATRCAVVRHESGDAPNRCFDFSNSNTTDVYWKISNCLSVGMASYGVSTGASSSAVEVYCYNHTVYGSSSAVGIRNYTTTYSFKNCTANDCSDPWNVSGSNSGSTNNHSDADTPPGTNTISGEVSFENETITATADMRPTESDTVLLEAGANLYTDSDIPVTVDIRGELRPQSGSGIDFDVGAFQVTPALTHYSITADKGTFTLTGQATSLEQGYKVGASVGAFTETGQSANLLFNRKMASATGAFTYTGNTANTLRGYPITAQTGTFDLQGKAVGLTAERTITASTEAFTLTGQAVTLARDGKIPADKGTFTHTGNATNLLQAKKITAGIGGFSYTDNTTTHVQSFFNWPLNGNGELWDAYYSDFSDGNRIQLATDPWGDTNQRVWESSNCTDPTYPSQGGIYINAQAIDNTKLYRYSFFEKRVTNNNATFAHYYFGLTGYGATNGVYRKSDGVLDSNPYFYFCDYQTSLNAYNDWVLVTGHIYPAGTTADGQRHPDSGVWKMDGSKLNDIYRDWIWHADTTTARPRTLAIYRGNVSDIVHYSAYPRIDICDGTEPSLQDLIDGRFVKHNNTAELQQGYKASAEAESFTFTGYSANLEQGYKISAETGSFTFTGNSANLKKGNKASAETGTFTLNGISANFLRGIVGPVDKGTFNLTGNSANLNKGKRIPASTGAFNLTGQDANFLEALKISIESGTFDFTGNAQSLEQGYKVTAESGTFNFTGQPASLEHGRAVTASNGTFILSGQNVNFTTEEAIQADPGTYALNGQDAQLNADRKINAENNAFDATGYPATFNLGRKVSSDAGNFTINANDAGLTSQKRAEIGTGTFTMTANAVEFREAKKMPADAGIFTLNGKDAGLFQNYAIDAENGAFTATGWPADFTKDLIIHSEKGTFTITPGDGQLIYGTRFSVDGGAFTLTGYDAQFVNWHLYSDSGTFQVTGNSVGFNKQKYLTASPGTFSLSGNIAGLITGYKINSEFNAFSFTGQNANLLFGKKILPEAGTFQLTGNSVTLTEQKSLTTSQGEFLLSGNVATLTRQYPMTAEPGVFTFTGYDAELSKEKGIAGETGTFTITGQSVGLGHGYIFTIDPGTFTVTGISAEFSGHTRVDQVSVAISDLTPTVLITDRNPTVEIQG